jgi:hypothetical protein
MAQPSDLRRRLLAFIRETAPFAYRDACLALRLGASLTDTAAALAALLAEGDEFERRRRVCYGCGRTLALTALADDARE